jgi:hypothetical protein
MWPIEKPALQGRSGPSRLFEPLANLVAYLVAAGGNGGPGGNKQIARPASELGPQRRDGNARHARRQPSPTGMGRSDCACATVGNEDRNAVGRLYGNRNVRIVGEHDVRRRASLDRSVAVAAHVHVGAMHLPDAHQR